jgi:hypothetical protein
MDRVHEFLHLYNQLDEHMRRILSADRQRSHAALLEQMAAKDPVFREHHSRLQAYRALRNSIVHVPVAGSPEPIAEPRDDVLEDYRMLVGYLTDPPTALDSIATRQLYTATWDTPVRQALSWIQERGFDTVPIVEGDRVTGMYTQHCLQRLTLSALAEGSTFSLTPDSRFADMKAQCEFSADDPRNERDCPALVRFVPAAAGVEFVEELFKSEARRNRFIAAVCVTPTGRAMELLLGLITPHNLPSANGFEQYVSAVRRRFVG